jgi:hypothetical protein
MKRVSTSIVLPTCIALTGFAAELPAATILLNPQPDYPLIGGVSCGGDHPSTYVVGFDANGNIKGEVYAWTRCGLSGRGGGYQSTSYSRWHSIVWDLKGTPLVTTPWDGITPDPLFVATDAQGDRISTVQVDTPSGTAYQGMLVTPAQPDSGGASQSTPAPTPPSSSAPTSAASAAAPPTVDASMPPMGTSGSPGSGGGGGGAIGLWLLGVLGITASARVQRRRRASALD